MNTGFAMLECGLNENNVAVRLMDVSKFNDF